MEKQNCCIVCGTENSEGEIECKRCHWPIRVDSPEIREEKQLKSAQLIWKSHSKIQRELEDFKRQNTNYSNTYSALQNSLQSLVGHQLSQIRLLEEQNNYLKQLSSEVTCIKEQLPSNFSAFKQAQNQESVSTEEGLDSQVSEEDNTNISDSEISQLNDTPEAIKIVGDYKQDVPFLDKVEVAETPESKSQRRDIESYPIF